MSSSTAISGITDDNYTHTSLDNGTTYYYKISAINSVGTGSASNTASGLAGDVPDAPAAPTVTAIAGSDMTVKPGDTVQFNGAGTSDEDGVIVLYEWDFDGDGIYELSSEDNGRTTNIYNTEGEYTPTLRVTDNIGHTASNSFKI